MASRKLSAAPPSKDPTLPTRVIPTKIGDIRLCLDCGALMDAEEALIARGHSDMQLLLSLQATTASSLRTFFVIAAQRFHLDLSVDELKALVTFENLSEIGEAITQLWEESLPKPKPSEETAANPPQPNQ